DDQRRARPLHRDAQPKEAGRCAQRPPPRAARGGAALARRHRRGAGPLDRRPGATPSPLEPRDDDREAAPYRAGRPAAAPLAAAAPASRRTAWAAAAVGAWLGVVALGVVALAWRPELRLGGATESPAPSAVATPAEETPAPAVAEATPPPPAAEPSPPAPAA